MPTPSTCIDDCACAVEPLAHPKYSFGMLLEPRILTLEHRYHALRANTHNIRLHDFGTVCGLRVDKHPSPQCVNTYAILRPGIALDCCGHEIVVPEDLFVPLKDGVKSGWCGATMAAPTSGAASANATKLYICLRYAQCDTDPIPTYVRACGCCGPCEHGDCTPSVTREGYEVLVTSTPPPQWENPLGKAFCDWLNVKLNGPGSSAPAQVLFHETLEQVLCDIITEPCANFCANGNDLLLLATASFNSDGTLTNIDNVTGRRLVISTGAIFEALMCLTRAQITCCAATDAYLTLAATVAPATVNLAVQPTVNSLSYTLTATNSDAQKDSESFELALAFPSSELTFQSATLTIAGAPAPAPSGDSTGVKATISKLPAGANAQLVVTATFDPSAHKAGDTIVSTASIADYVGDHGPDVTLTTSLISQSTDGPRVVTGNLVRAAGVNLVPLLQKGVTLPFTEAMDPSSAVPTTLSSTGSIVQGTVTLVLTYASLTHVPPPVTFPCKLSWNAANDRLTIMPDGEVPPSGASQWLANATFTLTAGPKGGTFTGPALRNAAKNARLDGSPSFPPGTDKTGESGDGTQGGDFVYSITGGR